MEYVYKSYYLDKPIVKGRIFDVFEPEKITKDTSIFWVHGGGWRAGSRESAHVIMEELCSRGYLVASTDYRLYAKDAFEQLRDIRESYDWFVTLLKELGRPLKIAVYGESAGAHLASLMVFANPGECGEDCRLQNDWVKPSMAMLQATPYNFLPWDNMMPQQWNSMQSIAGASYDEDSDRYKRLSLENYVREDNPPVFFMEAGLEHIFSSELTLKIAKKHREYKIPTQWKVYSNMEHGFFYELKRPGQLEALEDFCSFADGGLKTEF